MVEARCVWEAGAVLGEGPAWVAAEGAVYWVDIKADTVHRYHPASGERRSFAMAAQVCAVVPRRAGGFVATTRHGFAIADPAAGTLAPIAEVEPDRPGNRFNDAKADARGRLWAGTMDDACRRPTGTLYRLDADRSWRAMDGGYVVTNGPAFSPDGTVMYHNDTVNRRVFAFDLDDDGDIANKRTFLTFGTDDGLPDGMAVDAEGGLWVAHYGGGRVTRFTPDGRADHVVTLPVAQVTSCVFGGAGLDTLYVTSAAQDLDAEALRGQPLAGGLFEAAVGIRGLPTADFAG